MGLPRSALSSGRPLVSAPALAGSFRGPAWGWISRSSPLLAPRLLAPRSHPGRRGLALAGLAAGRWDRALAQDASGAMPKPIAGGGFEVEGELLHVYDYIPGNEPSTIGDFRGLVAINHLPVRAPSPAAAIPAESARRPRPATGSSTTPTCGS